MRVYLQGGLRNIHSQSLRPSPLPLCLCTPAVSVSNGSKLTGRFRVRFNPKPDLYNGPYHTKNPDCWKWAGFNTKNRAYQVHNFGSS